MQRTENCAEMHSDARIGARPEQWVDDHYVPWYIYTVVAGGRYD